MDSPLPAAVDGLGQVALTVRDVPQAVGFYRDILGLRLLFQAGPNLAFLDAGGVRLMLSAPQGHGEPGKNSPLYFRAPDLALFDGDPFEYATHVTATVVAGVVFADGPR